MASGGLDEALGAVDTFADFAMRNNMDYLADFSDAQRALLLAAEGCRDEAGAVLKAMDRLAADPEKYLGEAPWRAGEAAAEAALLAGGDFWDVALWRDFRNRCLAHGNKRAAARLSAGLARYAGGESDIEILEATLTKNLQRAILFFDAPLQSQWAARIAAGLTKLADSLRAAKQYRQDAGSVSAPRPVSSLFSQKEITVFSELAQGKSDKQIAKALNLSEHGVRYHLKNIYVKLGVSNRTDYVRQAPLLSALRGYRARLIRGDWKSPNVTYGCAASQRRYALRRQIG